MSGPLGRVPQFVSTPPFSTNNATNDAEQMAGDDL